MQKRSYEHADSIVGMSPYETPLSAISSLIFAHFRPPPAVDRPTSFFFVSSLKLVPCQLNIGLGDFFRTEKKKTKMESYQGKSGSSF